MVINVIIKRLCISHGSHNCRHVKCAFTSLSFLKNYVFDSVGELDFVPWSWSNFNYVSVKSEIKLFYLYL